MSSEVEVSIAQVRRFLVGRRYDEAEKLSRRLILEQPAVRDEALTLLGLSLGGLGKARLGEIFVRRALRDAPDSAVAHMALARILLHQAKSLEAVESFRQAKHLDPASPNIRRGLVEALLAADLASDAELECRDALTNDASDSRLSWLLVIALLRLQRVGDARICYQELVARDHRLQGMLPYEAFNALAKGDLAKMKGALLASVLLDPESRDAATLLLSMESGASGPASARAPDAWVRRVFDYYAPRFDEHLTGTLQYESPNHLAQALQRSLGEPARSLQVLDLGCGTGLAGRILRPYASRLVGVDLSKEMLARARSADLYDLLVEDEIARFLRKTDEQFDLVASTDVLIYVGDWQPVFAGVARVLRPGGWFAITAERHEGEGFVLHSAARYAHSLAYLQSTATSAGFQVEFVDQVSPRMEGQKPVPGLLALMRLVGNAEAQDRD